MKLHITGVIDAEEYVPLEPSYLITILYGENIRYDKVFRAIQHASYKVSHEYRFDDIQSPSHKGEVLFDESLATRVITDFQKDKDTCSELVVCCFSGENRSPSIGISLAELFTLNANVPQLKAIYSAMNKHVYRTMMKVGTTLLHR